MLIHIRPFNCYDMDTSEYRKRDPDKKFAFITGASKGLGKCLAIELAKKKINTILVALPDENVNLVSEQLKNLGTDSRFFETDLTEVKNILAITDFVNQNFSINILINNAGCGGTKRFLVSDADYLDHMIRLNITATSLITHQLLPNLLDQDHSYILNVSSMAAFCPAGYKTVYPASKQFIRYFSKSLRQELKKTKVRISVLYPGPMKTNEDATKRINRQRFFGRVGLLAPQKVAKIAISKLFRNHSFIIAGSMNKIIRFIMFILPEWITIRLMTKVFQRELEFDSD